jgi:hypothetical protein
MIKRIENWFSNRKRRKQKLEIIKKAKQVYLDNKSPYMCCCFRKVEPSFNCYEDIVNEIPEFKPSTFGLYINDTNGFWWSIYDRQSRIDAFDKLIEIYSK